MKEGQKEDISVHEDHLQDVHVSMQLLDLGRLRATRCYAAPRSHPSHLTDLLLGMSEGRIDWPRCRWHQPCDAASLADARIRILNNYRIL